jgi:hypothetical protein
VVKTKNESNVIIRLVILAVKHISDVRDIVTQEEYAIPHIHRSSSKTLKSQPSIHDDTLSHHQTLEKYYAASDICQVLKT